MSTRYTKVDIARALQPPAGDMCQLPEPEAPRLSRAKVIEAVWLTVVAVVLVVGACGVTPR